MIVASLLLILVAVTLLVVGLAGGSSMLLISSIVASLLAAVALVIGARHAAAQRRAVTPDGRTVAMDPDGRPVGADGLPLDLDDAAVSAAAGGRRTARAPRAGSDFSTSDHSAADFVASDGGRVAATRTDTPHDRVSGPGRATSDFSPSDADLPGPPHTAGAGFADDERAADDRGAPRADTDRAAAGGGRDASAAGDRRDAFTAGDGRDAFAGGDGRDAFAGGDRRDAFATGADRGGLPPEDGREARRRGAEDLGEAFAAGDRQGAASRAGDDGTAGAAYAEGRTAETAGPRFGDDTQHGGDRRSETGRPAPDYDRASSVIDAARTPDPDADAWRRDPDAEGPPARDRSGRSPEASFAPDSAYGEPAYAPEPTFAEDGRTGAGHGDPTVGSAPSGGATPAGDFAAAGDTQPAGGFPSAGAAQPAGGFAAAEGFPGAGDAPPGNGFDEPDDEDPADEPLPQAVRPGDAVRVARMDDDVLVVDGRPRYHLGDCPHLVGRLTEPLPAREAVELGFSPCGLCRPVDRLVARSAHH